MPRERIAGGQLLQHLLRGPQPLLPIHVSGGSFFLHLGGNDRLGGYHLIEDLVQEVIRVSEVNRHLNSPLRNSITITDFMVWVVSRISTAPRTFALSLSSTDANPEGLLGRRTGSSNGSLCPPPRR